jgi:hypothetical protein
MIGEVIAFRSSKDSVTGDGTAFTSLQKQWCVKIVRSIPAETMDRAPERKVRIEKHFAMKTGFSRDFPDGSLFMG